MYQLCVNIILKRQVKRIVNLFSVECFMFIFVFFSNSFVRKRKLLDAPQNDTILTRSFDG